ncbi:MAG: hypothetical protein RLZZ528_2678 [Pseudomonadota bacterium]
MEVLPVGGIAALVGLVVGLIMGFAARFGGFGTLSALRSAWELGDQRRVRLWGIIIGVAIVATFALDAFGYVRIAETAYHAGPLRPIPAILGGFAFGVGMALAGNCGFEALVRTGAGDVRALIIAAVIGITAMMTVSGPLSFLTDLARSSYAVETPVGIAHFLSGEVGLSPFFFAVILASLFIAMGLAYIPLRRSPQRLAWGAAVGLSVAFAFAGLTWIDASPAGPAQVDGPSFAVPMGQALLALMLPAEQGQSFAAGLVAGVLLAAFLGAIFRGFHRAAHTETHITLGRVTLGAALMGIGGAVAAGDIIGQGIGAMATLAWSGPVTLIAIFAGCWLCRGRLVAPQSSALYAMQA